MRIKSICLWLIVVQHAILASVHDSSFITSSKILWRNGIEAVNRGELLDGIKKLDSLRISGFGNDTFINDFAKAVFTSIIRVKDTVNLDRTKLFASTDTVQSSELSCNISSNGYKHPVFTYGAVFVYWKKRKLDFKGLKMKINQKAMLKQFHKMSIQTEPGKPEFSKTDIYDTAFFKICIDLNDTKSMKDDYIAKRIYGLYDSIVIPSVVPIRNSTYLRCFTRKEDSEGKGRFSTYVVFDCKFKNIFKSESGKNTVSTFEKARITLMMHSANTFKDHAEAKFRSLISSSSLNALWGASFQELSR